MRSCNHIGLSGICLQGILRQKICSSRSEWLSLDDDDDDRREKKIFVLYFNVFASLCFLCIACVHGSVSCVVLPSHPFFSV